MKPLLAYINYLTIYCALSSVAWAQAVPTDPKTLTSNATLTNYLDTVIQSQKEPINAAFKTMITKSLPDVKPPPSLAPCMEAVDAANNNHVMRNMTLKKIKSSSKTMRTNIAQFVDLLNSDRGQELMSFFKDNANQFGLASMEIINLPQEEITQSAIDKANEKAETALNKTLESFTEAQRQGYLDLSLAMVSVIDTAKGVEMKSVNRVLENNASCKELQKASEKSQ